MSSRINCGINHFFFSSFCFFCLSLDLFLCSSFWPFNHDHSFRFSSLVVTTFLREIRSSLLLLLLLLLLLSRGIIGSQRRREEEDHRGAFNEDRCIFQFTTAIELIKIRCRSLGKSMLIVFLLCLRRILTESEIC